MDRAGAAVFNAVTLPFAYLSRAIAITIPTVPTARTRNMKNAVRIFAIVHFMTSLQW